MIPKFSKIGTWSLNVRPNQVSGVRKSLGLDLL